MALSTLRDRVLFISGGSRGIGLAIARRAARDGARIVLIAKTAEFIGGDAVVAASRTAEIVADAAYEIVTRDPRRCAGNTFIDDEVLAEAGITDFDRYATSPGARSRLICSSRGGLPE